MISEELLQSFISEASDLLDDVEPALVDYPNHTVASERKEIVDRVFRHFHSIKGSAGFVGLDGISKLTHEAEALLEQFRKDQTKIIPRSYISLLCRTVDLLRSIFEAETGQDQDVEAGFDIEGLVKELSTAIMFVQKGKMDEYAAGAAAPSDTTIKAGPPSGPATSSASSIIPMSTPAPAAPAAPTPTPAAPRDTTRTPRPAPTRDTRAAPPRDTRSAARRESSTTIGSLSGGLTRTRRLSADTARVVHTNRRANESSLNTAEFRDKYVSEASELLEQTEQSLLLSEQKPDQFNEYIREALRTLHSFKGNSGFMGLADLEHLSHRMESEIENAISNVNSMDQNIFEILLQMIDVLRQGVQDFSAGGTGVIPEAATYIELLDEYTRSQSRHTNSIRRTPQEDASISAKATDDAKASAAMVSVTKIRTKAPDPAQEPAAKKKSLTRVEPVHIKLMENQDAAGGVEDMSAAKKSAAIEMPPEPPVAVVHHASASAEKESPTHQPQHTGETRISTKPEEKPARPKDTRISSKDQRPDTRALPKKSGDTDVAPKRKQSDTERKRRSMDLLAARNDIRVDLRKLDAMLDLVGEMVIAEAMVTRHPIVRNAESESLERAVHQLRRVAGSLQDMAMSVRMIPLATTFRRMTRLVYDLSGKAGKTVDLVLLGEETEVDRTVIERISDPLVHIIRNAVDHGIEPPEVRAQLGKPEAGRLVIEGRHEGGEVWIAISDDGKGLDRDAILTKAIAQGLVSGDGSDLTDNQVFRYIFEPGFSTAQKVTDISGRGFGMDVVRKNIDKLSGRVDIRTRPGEGTMVILRIPLTLAIIDGMLIRAGDTRFIIPLLSIRETLKPEKEQITSTPDGQNLIKLRNELIPIVRLDETFHRLKDLRDLTDGVLLIVEGDDGNVVALFADELLGQQETVIKGLSGWLKKSKGVSGCTILGDGEVGLILDIGAIVKTVQGKYTTESIGGV